MKKTSKNQLITKLKEIVSENQSIKALVAQEALDYTCDNPTSFFEDLLNHGCQSGMVSSLIYYRDTHNFYDKFYNEIEDLRYEFEENQGIELKLQGDLKNWFAWFAFEETARNLADELGL